VIVSAQLLERERQELEQLAVAADRTLSAEIRRAVREHLERANEQSSDRAETKIVDTVTEPRRVRP
jgi:predicted transcriptional regulator